MDTDFNTTQARYAEFLSDTPSLMTATLKSLSETDVKEFQSLVRSKKRIIFTGVGSSMPAALHGANSLMQQGMPAQFLPVGSVLGMETLSKDDAIVLSSQGVNRADALLIIAKIHHSQATSVLLSANQDKGVRSAVDHAYYFQPAVEKLFCRPTGVATNYALMEKLCSTKNYPDIRLVEAWRAGYSDKLDLPPAKRYIVLSSDAMMPVAWNVALALREGNGLHCELLDVETYGHGNYVGDLRDRTAPGDFCYIMVDSGPGTTSGKSVQRILPFVRSINAPFTCMTADYSDPASAGMHILASLARYVYDRNQADAYNMNKPIGKEENRYYHEIGSYQA